MTLKHLRSSTADKRPQASGMAEGQLAINTASGSPGLFFKDSAGNLAKVGPVHVGSGAPNASPASGGTSGNSLGEQWLDTSGGTYVFKIWDGAAWRSEAGEFVNTTGDTMTGALGIIAGSASTPGLFFSGDANSGLYSPGADQLAISTNGTGRLFVDASGNAGVGASPVVAFTGQTHLTVNHSSGGTTVAGINLATDGTRRASLITYPGNSEALRITAESTTLPITVHTNGAERLRITSAGLVGVGTSSPNSVLQVNSGTNLGGILVGFNSGSSNFYDADLQVFRTGNGTERVRIDSSGRLLVGTSSTSATSTAVFASRSDGAAAPLLALHTTESTVTNGANFATLSFGNTATTGTNAAAFIQGQRDGGTWTNNSSMPGRLVLSTTADGASSPTERMRLDSTGRCFFNTTASPSTTSFGTSIGTVLAHSRDTSTGAVAQIYGSAGEFRIIGSGNAQNTNNSYGAISDQSLKTDISDAGSQWDDIKGITVRKFKLIGTDTLQIGVVAQECELVSPGLVEDTVLEQEDGTTSTVKAVKYSVLYMKAVKALQEAMERIETLEAKVAALESA